MQELFSQFQNMQLKSIYLWTIFENEYLEGVHVKSCLWVLYLASASLHQDYPIVKQWALALDCVGLFYCKLALLWYQLYQPNKNVFCMFSTVVSHQYNCTLPLHWTLPLHCTVQCTLLCLWVQSGCPLKLSDYIVHSTTALAKPDFFTWESIFQR